jgi:hypothetical protein
VPLNRNENLYYLDQLACILGLIHADISDAINMRHWKYEYTGSPLRAQVGVVADFIAAGIKLELGRLNKDLENMTKSLEIWERPIVVKPLCYKPECRGFETPCGE